MKKLLWGVLAFCIACSLVSAEKSKLTEAETLQAKQLIRAAFGMTKTAYAPYSHFHVGAALMDSQGHIHTGANVENASYPAGCCAERTAIYHAAAHGMRNIRMIAICGGMSGKVTTYCTPCGVCRQMMREFCEPEKLLVIMAIDEKDYKVMTLAELLPESFGPAALKTSRSTSHRHVAGREGV